MRLKGKMHQIPHRELEMRPLCKQNLLQSPILYKYVYVALLFTPDPVSGSTKNEQIQ
jgi:hypothetical protein